MAQFDVYPNPNPASRAFVPFVVDVQSGLIDQLPSRLVMPLSRVGVGAARLPLSLCPCITLDGETLILLAHQAAAIPARSLKKPVASLVSMRSEISAALDAVISGI